MPFTFQQVIPQLRILDVAKADEFYLGFLGFTVDFDARFDDNAPLYRGISRGGLVLHLSEHHGDGTPGAHVLIRMQGLDAFHAELIAKQYRYMRPGIQTQEWGTREMRVYDPFGNQLCFSEVIKA